MKSDCFSRKFVPGMLGAIAGNALTAAVVLGAVCLCCPEWKQKICSCAKKPDQPAGYEEETAQ